MYLHNCQLKLRTCFDPFPVLVTERLTLREIHHHDLEEIYFLRAHKEVMRYTGQALAKSRGEVALYIQHHINAVNAGEGIVWGIVLKGETRLIGLIALRRFYAGHYRGEVGYGICPAQQRKGLMGEALRAVTDYGFNKIGLHSIEANVDKENTASIQLLERTGFVKEAHFTENYFFEGRFIDSVIYSLIDRTKAPEYYATV